VKAGIMPAGEGLHPTSKVGASGSAAARRRRRRAVRAMREPIAGFWLWKVASIDEAIDWAKRCPNPTSATS
jgi:hypothetical protein